MEDQATKLRRLVQGKNVYFDNSDAAPQSQASYEAPPRIIRPQVVLPWEQPAVQTPAAPPSFEGSGARIISVTSGKGGVGKTNLTLNLAIALGAMGQRVIVVDADLGMANIDILLGSNSKHCLMDLLKPGVTLQDVIMRGPYGVSYISGGSGMEHVADCTPMERQELFSKLASCDEWADIILIDTGAGIGKNVLDFIVASDEVLLITTPEPTALTDAYAVMKAYSRLTETRRMRLVVNRIYDERESREVVNKLSRTADKFLHMNIDCLGYIFDDRNMAGAVRKQVPLLAAYPNSVAARCIKSLASGIMNEHQEHVKLGWQGFLKKMIGL